MKELVAFLATLNVQRIFVYMCDRMELIGHHMFDAYATSIIQSKRQKQFYLTD